MNGSPELSARATRDGRWWTLQVSGLEEHLRARRLSDARELARDAIARIDSIPASDIAIEISYAPVGDVDDIDVRVARIARARAQAAQLEADAAEQTTALARDLAAAGVPLRDIGEIVGLSFQRIHQLLQDL